MTYSMRPSRVQRLARFRAGTAVLSGAMCVGSLGATGWIAGALAADRAQTTPTPDAGAAEAGAPEAVAASGKREVVVRWRTLPTVTRTRTVYTQVRVPVSVGGGIVRTPTTQPAPAPAAPAAPAVPAAKSAPPPAPAPAAPKPPAVPSSGS